MLSILESKSNHRFNEELLEAGRFNGQDSPSKFCLFPAAAGRIIVMGSEAMAGRFLATSASKFALLAGRLHTPTASDISTLFVLFAGRFSTLASELLPGKEQRDERISAFPAVDARLLDLAGVGTSHIDGRPAWEVLGVFLGAMSAGC
jgi:hypothetical protein